MRWIRRLLVLLLTIVVALGVFGIYTVRRSFPQVQGEIVVSVLDAPVQVIRDTDGIPHIYASNAHDMYLAQGYVEAQDRFWQMDFFRHIGAARLSEMFGDSQIETDMFLRSLGLVDLAEIELERLDDGVREILQWYAQGVNAYLAERNASDVSLEYAVLGINNSLYAIEPWDPIDTLTWAKMMSWDLAGNMEAEIGRAVLSADLPIDRIEQLFPEFPDRHPSIVDSNQLTTSREMPELPTEALAALASVGAQANGVWDLTGGGFEGIGSNNWVVGGSRTNTGKPILANDPHLGIRMPSIWYEIGLHCTTSGPDCVPDVVGFTFAGTPGIIVGHNSHIAWGVTNEAVDTQDLYIERVNPNNPNQYEVDGGWVDMEIRTETIRVAGVEDLVYEVRSTRHGPIISGTFLEEDHFDETALDIPEQYVIALSWQSLQPSTLTEAIVGLNRATNYEEFRAALSLWDIAPQSIVYADIEGNIAYQSTGEIPVRAQGDGRYPVPGWSSDYEWLGVVPFDEMPLLLNPAEDYVHSANQPVTRLGVGPFDGHDAALGYRASRIVDMIENNSRHTTASVRQLQMDARDGGAENLMPYLLDCMGCVGGSEQFQEMASLLEDWITHQSVADSPGAAAYQAVWRHLLRLTFHDELPEDYWPGGGSRWFEVMKNLLETPDDPWWDDVATNFTETRDEIIEQAMIAAHIELTGLLGRTSDNWSWGRLHIAKFENETLGQSGIAPIEWLFNRAAPERVGGSESLINATGWDPGSSYEVDWVPSFRMVVDLSDFSNSTSINTTGNSGHAFNHYYDNMIVSWTDGDQHPMRWDAEKIEADAAATLTLVPEPG